MNHKHTLFSIIILFILLIATGSAYAYDPDPVVSGPIGTVFTYQGRLTQNGTPANGAFDFEFYLFDAFDGGSQVGGPVPINDLMLTDGYFTVQLDFGVNAFIGQARFLEVRVRLGSNTGGFTILAPRQELTATPNAIYSLSAPWSGLTGVPAGFADGIDDNTTYTAGTGLTLIGGQFSVDTSLIQRRVSGTCAEGSSIRVINADGSVTCETDDNTTSFWSLTGNAGTNPATNYLGSSDNQPLELRVNGQRVLRLVPITTATHGFAPNILGGYGGNTITSGVSGVTIAGGGKAGWLNWVTDDFGTIGGGLNNQAGDNTGDFLSAPASTVGGGSGNKASGDAATVSGGWSNTASGGQATVCGGVGNTASGSYSTVPGGSGNTAAGSYSLAAGYMANTTAAASGSFVWADATGSGYTSSSPNEFRVRAANGVRFLTSSMDGLFVDNSASASNGDGIHSEANVSLGSNYGAVFARNNGTSPGIVASTGSSGTYAGVFTNKISVSGGCVGCALIYIAQNKGSESLEMGDVTVAVGVGDPLNTTDAPMILVQRAGGTDAAGVVGVVLGKAVLNTSSQDGQTLTGAEAATGPAAPGEYVFIVVQGVAYVKADASGGAIVTGQRLTASNEAGMARVMQTRTFEEMTITEDSPIIGVALASLDNGQGLIPVMVTLR